MTAILTFIGGLLVGAIIIWLVMRSRQQLLQQQVTEKERRLEELRLRTEAEREQLANAFANVSQDVLKKNSDSFLQLAEATIKGLLSDAKGEIGKQQESIKGTVEPLSKALEAYDRKMQDFEKTRSESFGTLAERISQMQKIETELKQETSNLATALRRPEVRGRWGEVQLRRAAELAGMSQHCDFEEQVSDADSKRPDMIVNLPGDRKIIVDSKAVLDHYVRAEGESDPTAKQELLKQHAAAVRSRVRELALKSYQSSFEDAADFVVLFIPGEGFYAAALEADPELLEDAVSKNVFIASPTILITLLRAVNLGWREKDITDNAREISEKAATLYDRIATWLDHYAGVRKGLQQAVDSYNSSVGSVNQMVKPAAQRLKELSVPAQKVIPEIEPVDETLRKPDLFDSQDS